VSVRRRVAIAALTALAVLSSGLALAAPASAATDTTFFSMSGDAGDWISQGSTWSYAPANSTFNVQGTSSFVQLSVSGAQFWQVWFRAPDAETLTVGRTYTGAQRAAFVSGPTPGFDVFGDGRGCNTVAATFTVLDLATDAGTGAITRFAGTFESHCDGVTPAARGAIYFHAAIPFAPGAAATLSGPSTAPSGDPVVLHGSLSNGSGPIATATVGVTRHDGSGDTVLPDVVSGADGTFTVTDTMPSTDATYTATFAGNGSVQPLTATHDVRVGPYASTITLTGPTTGARGVRYSVAGVLASGGTPLVGASVALTRVDLAGTKHLVATTNASGGYSLSDLPAVGGPVTWTATYAGDVKHTTATATKVVTIARSTAALSVRASASIYTYGARATVTVHLGTTYNRRDVYVYARPLATSVGAPGTLIAHVKVNSAGNAVVSYTMKRRTTFTARFAGDYRYNIAARAVSPYVRAKVTVTLAGYYSKSGSTFLYRGKDPAQMISAAPNRAGTCFSTLVQAFQGGRWQSIASLTCGSLDSTSRGYAIFYSNRARGILVRIHATIPNDSASQTLGATSAWVYLKFT
jgi:hypothetical protein